jgi:hypothetical protein
MPQPAISSRSKVVACTEYTPTALMARMPGTSSQLGRRRMRVNTPTSGMLMNSSITLATNSEAIRPQTRLGFWVNRPAPA